MSNRAFLLEIGTEEIPDWMIERGLAQLEAGFVAFIASQDLPAPRERMHSAATPRRLTLYCGEIPERQADKIVEIKGPAAGIGFKDGKFTPAALGFARKQSATEADLIILKEDKGEYVGIRRAVQGRPTADLLAEALPGLITKIQWPKTMYWTPDRSPRFIRPIRWLVALLDDEVVPFEIAGVRSSHVTRGHRRLGAAAVPVTIANYTNELKANGVILMAEDRRRKIQEGIAALLKGTVLEVQEDAALLETLVYITEFPTPILGGFEREFLTLPREVLVTVMRHHQKYFSVEDAEGKLAPHFIAVMNTKDDPEGLVRQGNERVLRARFNDARFFWNFDQQKPLAERVQDLASVTFQAKLGSYLEKTNRVASQARALAKVVKADTAVVERAAMLAKCDLTTEMVKEFTDLQGVVGGLYARAQGEPEAVAQAIYDHYKPVSMEDSIPRTVPGQLVSLADKLDTLRGCFQVGLIPTSSKDPFALRRAAQGIVKILVEGKLSFSFPKLIGNDPQLHEFMLDRVKYYFREVRGFKYDEVNAVLASTWDNLADVEARLTALQAVRPTENFEPLAASFKRISNILKQAGVTEAQTVNDALLEPGPETTLAADSRRVVSEISAKDYGAAFSAIATLRPAIDAFFDKVLVNDPRADVRQNRLGLLFNIFDRFTKIADFSEIVVNDN